jgi:hypothetical protein
MIGLQPAHTLMANRTVRSAIGWKFEMPLTSGSRADGTKLYSLTVVMPELSGFSAPPASCATSSFEKKPPPLLPIAPNRHSPRPTRPMTTTRTAT